MESSVVVITLNYNQNEYTLKCIDSLIDSKYINFKILLIDNGSDIESFNTLKDSIPANNNIQLLRIEENIGYVGGINFGLKETVKLNPDFCIIMNNDTIIDQYAIEELVNASFKYSNSIITGKVYHYNDPQRFQYTGQQIINKSILKYEKIGFNEIDIGQYDTNMERDMIDDIFWIFPFELYKQIGGYSEYFWFNNEQADFALRAKQIGYKLIYAHKAKLWHKGSVSVGGKNNNPALVYWGLSASLIFRFIHLNKFNFWKYYFVVIISIVSTYIKAIFFFLLKNESKFKYANAKMGGLKYFNKWLIKRNVNTGKNPFNK